MRRVILSREGPPRCSNNSIITVVRNVKYCECRKNHAANSGGYAVDGCAEFLPGGAEATNGALTCAACGCHRNFHRKETHIELVCGCTSHPSTSGA